MSRRSLIWHLGLSQPVRPVVGASLAAHRDALAQCGRVVVASPEEAAPGATHELLGSQAEAGLRRAEVDGTWARVCDRVWAHKGVSLLSTPDLGAADKDQLRLALDPLIGVEVHLVVTLDSFSQQIYGGWLAELRAGGSTGWDKYAGRVLALGVDGTKEHRQAEDFWAGHELASLLARWGWTFHADRLHVVAEPDPVRQWAHLLDLAGCGAEVAAGLPAVLPPYADPAGVAVLRKVNRQLEDGLAPGSVALLTGDRASDRAADRERAAMPVASTEVLEGLLGALGDHLCGRRARRARRPGPAGRPCRGDHAARCPRPARGGGRRPGRGAHREHPAAGDGRGPAGRPRPARPQAAQVEAPARSRGPLSLSA